MRLKNDRKKEFLFHGLPFLITSDYFKSILLYATENQHCYEKTFRVGIQHLISQQRRLHYTNNK